MITLSEDKRSKYMYVGFLLLIILTGFNSSNST